MVSEESRNYRIWCLVRDQIGHIKPVEAWFGNRAEFIYDTDHNPDYMLRKAPDIVLCVNDFPYDIMQCIDAAHKTNIPSLVLQDGILEWRCQYENPIFGFGGGAPQHQPVIASKIACIGNQSARQIAAWGNSHKVEVTGMPRMDYLRDFEVPPPTKPGKRLLVMTAKKPGFTPEQIQITLRSLQDVQRYLSSRADIEVVWRITKSLHTQLGVENQLKDLASQELAQILSRVDAVITTPSTAMLEAMLLRRPVAALDYHNVPRFVLTAWTISAPDHVEPVINELLSPPANKLDYQDFCLHDCLYLKFPAAQRVGELIIKMVAASREIRTETGAFRLPSNLLGYGELPVGPPNLGTLYPNHEAFQENDLQALQVRYARLQKENEQLKQQIISRTFGYWLSVGARYIAQRVRHRGAK